MARQKGIPIITGIEMFVQQGARQFEIFTGKPAPEEEMLRVVIHSLRQQAEPVPEAPAPKASTAKAPAEAKKAAPAKAKKVLDRVVFEKKMRPRCEPGFCCFAAVFECVLEKAGAERGFFVVGSWWIAGETWRFDDRFPEAKTCHFF